MRKALITARFTEEAKGSLRPFVEISEAGYGKSGQLLSETDFLAKACKVEVLVVELQPVTKVVIETAPNLEVIGSCRGTPNNVDIAAANRRGIPVLYTPGRNATSVAEITLSLMLNLARNVLPAVCSLREDGWGTGSNSPFIKFRGIELYGKTNGIVGLGAVGREMAKRAVALGMKVLVTDPYVPTEAIKTLGGISTTLKVLLESSDFVSLHAKLTNETRGMIGAAQLARMKKSAYLINTASGLLVDYDALLTALRERQIAGAGLDVFAIEPLPQGHPLLNLDNVVATPHIGGATSDVAYHQSVMMAEDLKRYLTGEMPKFVYNRELFAGR